MENRNLPGVRAYGLLGALVGFLGAAGCVAQTPPRGLAAPSLRAREARARALAYQTAPLSFEVNAGQVRKGGSERVEFLARGRGYTLFLTSTGAILKFQEGVSSFDKHSPVFDPQISILTGRGTPSQKARGPSVLRLHFVSANPRTKVVGLRELPGKTNYFIGDDPAEWHRNIATYERVKVQGVYPGIDAIYYGRGGELEYDFVVAPGADPKAIRLEIETGKGKLRTRKAELENRLAAAAPHSPNSGLRADWRGESRVPSREIVRIAANGDLVVVSGEGEIRLRRPVAYQESPPTSDIRVRLEDARNGSEAAIKRPTLPVKREYVDAHYLLRPAKDRRTKILEGYDVSFEIAAYDRTKPLIVDPVLSYSTYLGGSGYDYAYGVAVDASGNAYVTGQTDSLDFPTASASQKFNGGGTCGTSLDVYPCFDAFVTKLAATGSSVVYSTYLGGSGDDRGKGIALDSSGNAYVAGFTNSADFPVANAFQSGYAGGNCGSAANPDPCYDAFVAKLDASGTSLVYSTYLGGTGQNLAAGIAVDAADEATIVGSTSSPDFPTTPGAVQTSYAGGSLDAFASKLDATGSRAVYSTYLGGSDEDRGLGIAVDAAGNAFVTGSTASADFPSVHALQPALAGGTCGSASPTPCTDAFVTRLNAAGTVIGYSTYLGGTGGDSGNAIAVDASGAAYVAGMTASSDFPVTPGSAQQIGGGASVDAFVAKISSDGSATDYCTYLGGMGAESAYGIAVDSSGESYVTGYVYGDTLRVASPIQETTGGFYDAFLTELNPAGSAAIFSSYLGGSGDETGQGIAVDGAGNAYVAGGTFSADFPIVSAAQPAYGGGSFDAFVAKISGFGRPELALSGSCCTFAEQGVATTSLPKMVTLINRGAAPARLSFVLSGDFTQTNNCGTSLGPGASCVIQLRFAPTAMGNRTGTLIVADDSPGSSLTIQLSGTAVAAFSLSLAPSDATVVMGTDSASFTVTATSPFSYQGEVSLACDGGAPVQCAFTPTVIVPGTQSILNVANLSHSTFNLVAFDVEGEGLNQTATLPLTIIISDFKINAASPVATVSAGQAASFQMTLEAINGFNQPVTMDCNGAPPEATCAISPFSLTPNAPVGSSVMVTVTTTARASGEPRVHVPDIFVPAPGCGWLWGGLAAALCLAAARKWQGKVVRVRLTAATMGIFLLLGTSCGGGGGPGIIEQKAGTPVGRYILKVSGTSGQLIRSVNLTLQVN